MLKKMTLLAMAVGALMAFAIPAVASADQWTLDGSTVGGKANAVTVHGTGTLSATIPTKGLELGPCLVHFHGDVWNENEEGTGSITNFEITPVHLNANNVDLCQVWILNGPNGTTGTTLCDITEATVEGLPWTITTTGGGGITIDGSNFTDKFSAGCPLGASGGAAGTTTGTFSSGSIGFSNSGDMKNAGNEAVNLDGSVSITPTPEGHVLTLD